MKHEHKKEVHMKHEHKEEAHMKHEHKEEAHIKHEHKEETHMKHEHKEKAHMKHELKEEAHMKHENKEEAHMKHEHKEEAHMKNEHKEEAHLKDEHKDEDDLKTQHKAEVCMNDEDSLLDSKGPAMHCGLRMGVLASSEPPKWPFCGLETLYDEVGFKIVPKMKFQRRIRRILNKKLLPKFYAFVFCELDSIFALDPLTYVLYKITSLETQCCPGYSMLLLPFTHT